MRHGRGLDDSSRTHDRVGARPGTRTQDQHQTRTRTRGADDVADVRRARGRGTDDALSLKDDRGGRTARDARFEPGDDRRKNGQ